MSGSDQQGRDALTVVDATQSAGVLVRVGGALVTITPHLTRDEVSVVVTPDEQHGYRCAFRWFPGMFGRLGQLVARVTSVEQGG